MRTGAVVRRASCPRAVRAEAPEVPLGVTDGVPAGAVVRVLELHHDLGARGLRARVVRVHVLDVDVHSLLHGVPRVVGAGPVLSRPEHDHAGAELHLRVGDGPLGPRHHHLLLEAEGPGEPFESGRPVLVSQSGEDVRAPLRWVLGHVIRPSFSRTCCHYVPRMISASSITLPSGSRTKTVISPPRLIGPSLIAMRFSSRARTVSSIEVTRNDAWV